MRLLPYSADELKAKLEVYLEQDDKFKQVFEYTKQRLQAATHLPAHNWAHAYRDTISAIVIGEAEVANMSIVLPAAVMHDIGFLYDGATGKTHGAIGANKLSEYLQQAGITYDQADIDRMASCIRTHKGSMHNEKPETLEARVVADADLMEKFGPFGVYQFIRSFTEFNKPLEEIFRRATEIVTLTLETPTGQKLAEPGRQFVADFFTELQEAAEPYA